MNATEDSFGAKLPGSALRDDLAKVHHLGTHRICTPEETLARVERVRRSIGITRVGNITGLDVIGIPVWFAVRPNSRSLAMSQGKGLDDVSARVSAIMESIEAHHAERITRSVILATHEQMKSRHDVVDVHLLPRTARPFDSRTPILWIEARDLNTDRGVWLPFELVHLNYTVPALPGSGLFVASSNGLASGNHIQEAICHGLCEIVERDAATLWALSGAGDATETRIDLGTVDVPEVRDLLIRYERAGIAVAVWDITSNVGIPAFNCAIADRASNPMRPLSVSRGMGCHPTREVALSRALTEAAQSRLTVIAGSRDDLSDERYNQSADHAEMLRKLIVREVGGRDFRSVVTLRASSVDEDVGNVIRGLRSAGCPQVLVVDLTDPDLCVPVARVVVPGMEALHDSPGFVPGRRARVCVAERTP